MFVKTGVVVATAAAALLAVSPLAFAGDYSGGNDRGNRHSKDHGDHRDNRDRNHGDWNRGDQNRGDRNRNAGTQCNQDNSSANRGGGGGGGLLNLSGNTIQVPVQACGNNILTGVLGILSSNDRNINNN